MGLRYVHFKLEESETLFHDADLQEAWYYVGDERMPELAPDEIYSCGTKFPIWLNGQHPTDDIAVDLTACVRGLVEECTKEYPVKVLYCPKNSTFLYYLGPAGHFTEGYCFGEGNPGNKSEYIVPKPNVRYELRTTPVGNYVRSRVEFICDFIESTDKGLYYQVSWHRHGHIQYVSPYKQDSNDQGLYLTEQLFVSEDFHMGDTISCSVRVYTIQHGPPGQSSEESAAFFVGIEIRTPELTFPRGSNDNIKITPTVPIGCEGSPACSLRLTTYTNEECTEVAVYSDSCGIKLESKDGIFDRTIPITNSETGQYMTKTESYEIYLKTDDTPENLIWRNYHLPPVKVNMTPNLKTGIYEGKTCYAHTDPHMRTYGGRKYDNHQEGVFTIYENRNFQSKVQIQHEMCNTRDISRPIMCPCGVAVLSGNDRYIISVCDKQMTVGYLECGDHDLKVKRVNIYHYKLVLPYGTYVEALIRDNPWNGQFDENDRVMEVDLKPSIHDSDGGALGLCGKVDDNNCLDDFHDREGNKIDKNDNCDRTLNINNQPKDFINAWSVTHASENLFSDDYVIEINETAIYRVCNCPKTTDGTDQGTDTTSDYIPCNPNTAAVCMRGTTLGEHSCDSPSRRRRSVRAKPKIPVVKITKLQDNMKIEKRETVNQNWTEAMAQEYCSKYMDDSAVFALCGNVPHARPYEAVETCVMDILLTNGPVWAALSMENMQTACLSELERNTTLRESSDDEPSIAEIIEEKACPVNCSGVGTCVKGQCECNQGYGASDCSIDLSRPPVISGLLDDGLCDERHLACDHAYVFGHIFTDVDNLTCKFEEFSLTVDGVRSTGSTFFNPGEFETLIEVMCPLHQVRHKRYVRGNQDDVFVIGYSVSVSNDGNMYEKGHDLFVYDSECQRVERLDDQVHFRLEEDYCFIENSCVKSGERNSQHNCSVCDVGNSTLSWTVDHSIEGCEHDDGQLPDEQPPDESEDGKVSQQREENGKTNYLWIIGVASGVVVGAAVATIIIVKLLMRRSKRVGDSTMLDTTQNNVPIHEDKQPKEA